MQSVLDDETEFDRTLQWRLTSGTNVDFPVNAHQWRVYNGAFLMGALQWNHFNEDPPS